jgi:hypothetical protein
MTGRAVEHSGPDPKPAPTQAKKCDWELPSGCRRAAPAPAPRSGPGLDGCRHDGHGISGANTCITHRCMFDKMCNVCAISCLRHPAKRAARLREGPGRCGRPGRLAARAAGLTAGPGRYPSPQAASISGSKCSRRLTRPGWAESRPPPYSPYW